MPNPLLDLRYLRYAFAAAEHRSFRRTALTLGVPQSTVTRRIQILEARLGADIFLRHRAGVDLTLAGEQFLREARSSVDRLLQSADELASARRGIVGELRIGFVASLNRGGLRDLLATYRANFPGARVTFTEDSSQALIADVLSGRLDIAFVAGDPAVPGAKTLPLWSERLLLAMSAGHRLANEEVVPLDELAHEQFLIRHGAGREVEEYVLRHLSSLGFSPNVQTHRLGRQSLMNLVALGFGVTITADSSVVEPTLGVVYRPLVSREPYVPWSGFWNALNGNPTLKQLVALARKSARNPAVSEPFTPSAQGQGAVATPPQL